MTYLYAFVACLLAMLLDIVCGYCNAQIKGKVDSSVMRSGLMHKMAEIMSIVLGLLCEYGLSVFGSDMLGISATIPIYLGVCAYVFVTEIVSIIENLGKINPALKAKLVDVLGIDPKKFEDGEEK